jgi:hypothetical protein
VGTAPADVAAGATVVATTTDAGAAGATGAAVAAAVAVDWGVLDVQPANSAETRSSPQTILTRINVCTFDLCCMVIIPLQRDVGRQHVKLFSFIFQISKLLLLNYLHSFVEIPGFFKERTGNECPE